MSVVSGQDYYWAFTGDGTLDYAWLYLQSSDGSYVNNHWRINSLLFGGWTSIGYVDMGLNASFTLARDEDWLTLSNNIVDTGHFRLNLKGVEYIDAPLDKNISLEVVSKEGFTTDGSLISLSMNVGNHTLNYWDAARDSTLFQGSGWDTVNLNDNPDIPGTQYWSLIRRSDGQIDAYSLFSGNRIRLEGGTVTWNNNNNTMNYGEVEKFFMKNARTGGTETPEPGNVIPTTGEKYLDINIDLRSYENGVNTYFSDSFNLAYFNYIRYTSDNIWTGEATIYEGLSGRYSAVSNTQVAGATVLPVAGTNRNGTHDLIVGEQASYIDGQLRLYSFNVASGSYNTFNDVFLGDSGVDGKSYSGNTATAVDRVAMYGFGGNDILTGGSGNDYIFGGQGYYNQLTGDTGNQITGGAGADFFGVGNTNTSGTVTGSNTWAGYNSSQAELGYAADRITDWHAGTDTLEVLSNGVAVISGLYGVIGMAGNNTLDLRDYSSVVTVNQDGDSARGNDNWDSTQSLQYVYDNQTSRDLQSIKNEGSDISVVNNGLIIARGQGGDDTVYGSAGNDYIYGNEGRNLLNLSEGGNDRAFLDTRSGKQYVSDFNASGSDKFYLAKNIVDAFGGNSGRSMAIYDTISSGYNYTHGSGYSQGIDFLYGLTYKSYLSNAYGSQPYTNDQSYSMDLSADITTYVSGIVSIGIGIGLCFIPFIGPALGAPLIATGTLLTAGKIYSDMGNTSLGSVPHINPVYDLTPGGASFTSNYVYVLDNPYRPATTAATGSSLSSEDNLRFLDFFPQAYKNDGFTAALELNPGYWNAGDTGDGIFGYFVVYSNSETFVYLVTSQDHLIENHEAMKVAELSGFRSASDFVVYDSNYDPYNQRADAAVVLKKPTITQVIENSGPTYTANVPLLEYTQSPYLKVLGSIASIDPGRTATTTVNKVELFDSNSPENGVVGTAFLGGGATTFEINDTRVLGQLIIQTDYSTVTGALNPLSMDNTFEYQDRRVIYYATLYNDVDGDGEMVIETRSNTFSVIDNGPSTATVDGGAGTDTLMLESTSLHLNNASDAQILSIEMISVKPPMGPGLSVTVSGGAVTSVNILDSGAKIADGTYDLTLSDDTTSSESGATGWKVVVSGGKVTSVIAGSGGSGYTESTYANAEWVPVGVTIDIHAQSEGFTVTGYQGADSIIGAQGNDVINGLNANDTIDGGTGNDTIEGGAGQDNLAGGAGGDTFLVTSVSDFAAGETISGGANTSTVDRLKLSQVTVSGAPTAPVTSAGTGTYSSAQLSGSVTGVEVIELAVNADYSLTLANGIYAGVDADGNGSEDNTLTITPTVNLTNNVTIVGGATTASYELQVLDNGFLDGNDSITGGAGNDTLQGGFGNDTLSGGAIATYSGSDSIDAGGGNDLIVQTLYQTGNDTIIGGADVDKLTVTQSNGLTDLDNVTQVETIELLSGLGANFSYTISDSSAFDADATGVTIDGDALTSTEALAFSATNLTRSITILGGAGNDTIIDGGGNDSIVTNAGNDNITLSRAGVNTVSSGSGTDSIILGAGTDLVDAGSQNDTVVGGANVTVADTLDGGADIDLLTISDDNDTDDLDNVTRFETIELAAGQSYQYVIGNNSLFDQDTVAVTVDAQALGSTDSVNFDASNLDRSITILFGAGDDTIYGGNGTSDSIHAGGGNDLIIMSNQLNGTDSIDGGSGNDRLTFSDNGTATSDLDHVTNIEVITLGDSVTSVVTVDALVASGQTLTIDATGLTGTNTLNWDGSAETNGHFSVDGSGNNDTITGGAGNDTFTGGAGVDSLTGGNGNDVFVYNSAVPDQSGAGETIAGGNNTDTIVVAGGSTMVNFSNDSISNIETLEMTLDVLGNADGNDQTLKMTDGQVDALSTINANDGNTAGSSDRIIISDTMTSDMLSNVAVGSGITVVNGTLTIELTEQSSATAQALTLVEGNLTSSSDLLKVDASTLTTDDTLSFNAAAETTARVSVTGGVSDDLIVGSNANLTDTLSGGSGNDTIEGKAGVDSLLGNDGDDTFVYDSATTDATGSGETINGGNDTDRILVAGGNTAVDFSNDTIISIETLELAVDLAGTAEINNQQVSLTNNQVDGLTTINSNGDTVTVSNTMLSGVLDGTTINGTLTMALTDQSGGTVVAQALTLVDGTLDDTAGDVLKLDGSGLTSDTLNFNGAAENDSKVSVTGGAGNDTIVGANSALRDTLDGGSGNDTIRGNAGADSLVGGVGNDTFVYNSASDESAAGEVIDGGSDTDRILVTGSGAATVDFTNDTISSIETLDMTQDSVGATDGADQTVRMTNAQIDDLSSIYSNAGSSTADVSDKIIVSNALTANMLNGTVVNGTLTLQLTDQGGAAQALTLVEATSGATDLLKVDASGLSLDTFSFNASGDTNSSVSVTGGSANDTLVGSASSIGDTLAGGLGADSITGGAGHDSVLGGGGADTITMSIDASSIDTIDAGSETDWLVLTGAAAGTVVLNLNAGAGNDQLSSISGTAETIVQANFENLDASAMTGGGINATAISTGSNIIGTALGDTITGGNGNDTITGGAGSDSMTGGAGNDLFVVGGTDVNGDTIQGNGDTDTLQLTANTDLTQAASFGGVETLLLDEGVALTINNAQLADVDAIVGTGDNGGESLSITASGGDDTIDLSASAFTLDTNDVSIAVEAGAGNDMVTLTAGNDSVNGGDGNDTIIGGAGTDTINGGNGTDLVSYADITASTSHGLTAISGVAINLSGAAVSQTTVANSMLSITGNFKFGDASTDLAVNTVAYLIPTSSSTSSAYQRDTLISIENATATSLDDYLLGSTAANMLSGGAGNDFIDGGGGSDTLYGNQGNDYLSARDNVTGVTMDGGDGNDTLHTGSGVDSLVGGDGNDVFMYLTALDLTGVGETISGGNGDDTILVLSTGVMVDFTDDVITSIENLQTSTSDANAQTVKMSNVQVDGLSSINAQAEDLVILSDAMTSSMLDGTRIYNTVTFQLIDQSGATVVGQALTLVNATLGGASDLLKVDASGLSSDTFNFNASAGNFGSVSVTGGDANDTLVGSASSIGDTLAGGAGADNITGGAGHDSVLGGDGADTITMSIAASSIDTIDAGNQADWLVLNGAATGTVVLNLNAGAGNDQLTSINSAPENIVQANFENLDASAMTGGGINATAISTGSDIIGSAQADTITGGNGNDTITGGVGNDQISGGSGNDLVVVNGTADIASGESYSGGLGADTLKITADTDLTNVSAMSSMETLLLSDAVDVTIAGALLTDVTAINGTGDDSHETVSVFGTSGADALNLSGITIDSNDIDAVSISGLAGNDTITASTAYANFSIDAGSDNDLVRFAAGDLASTQTVVGNSGTDTLSILGADTLTDADFTNVSTVEVLQLSGGNDSVDLTTEAKQAGILTVNGGAGNDTITWTYGTTGITIDAGDGDDFVDNNDADVANDSIDGGNGNDTIYARGGNDTLIGGAGNDILHAEDGNDSLVGGAGADVLNGGSGNDTLVVSNDVVTGESYDGSVGTDTLQITATTDFSVVTTIDSIEVFTLSEGVTATFAASALTGDTIAMSGTGDNLGEFVVVNGTSSAEVIDLSNITVDINDITGISVTGLGGDDTITGTNGNDTIVGGAGADVLAGGNGNDTLVINSGDVASGESYDGGFGTADNLSITADSDLSVVTALTNIEIITLANGVDVTFSAAALTGDTLALNGTGDNALETVTVTGTSSGDTINLSGITVDTNDITGLSISGGNGNDTITGTNGADTIVGGAGADVLAGGDGNDTLVINSGDVAAGESYDGGNNSDTLSITADMDLSVVTSLTSIETITLANGVDVTFSAAALTGDTLALNGTGDNAQETVSVTATAGNDTINLSGITVDTNDITGLYIDGGDGNDTITGTNGADTLTGGVGNDVFVFSSTAQTATSNSTQFMDVISDFNITEDTVDVSGISGAGSFSTSLVSDSDGDDYILQWTSGVTTNYVLLNNTGVTGGLTVSSTSGSLSMTATAPTGLTFDQFTVTSTSITVSGSGPFRAFLTPDTITNPDRNDPTTYYTKSTNYGASNAHSFDFTVIKGETSLGGGGYGTSLPHPLVNAKMTIQNTNNGLNSTHPAYVFVGDNASGAVNDTLTATKTDGPSIMYGFDGNDSITGGVGNDTVFGGSGNDTITGGASSDTLSGGAGVDKFSYNALVGTTSDSNGDAGNVDTITDLELTDFIYLNLTNVNNYVLQNVVMGDATRYVSYNDGNGAAYGQGDIYILTSIVGFDAAQAQSMTVINAVGTTGDDTIAGGVNNDTISGGGGSDVLTGGAGSDTFIMEESNPVTGLDMITDFTAGVGGDVLDFWGAASYDSVNILNHTSGATGADITLSNGTIYRLIDNSDGLLATADFVVDAAAGSADTTKNLIVDTGVSSWLIVGDSTVDTSVEIYHVSNTAGTLAIEHLTSVTLVGASTLNEIVAGNIVV